MEPKHKDESMVDALLFVAILYFILKGIVWVLTSLYWWIKDVTSL